MQALQLQVSKEPIALIKKMIPHRLAGKLKRIGVRTHDALHLLKVEEIVRCEADNNYAIIYYGNGNRLMVSKTLKAVSGLLPDSGFFRIHKSHIVRLDSIHLVYPDHIVLYNGDSVPLSRYCKADLVRRLDEGLVYL